MKTYKVAMTDLFEAFRRANWTVSDNHLKVRWAHKRGYRVYLKAQSLYGCSGGLGVNYAHSLTYSPFGSSIDVRTVNADTLVAEIEQRYCKL